MFRKLVGGLTQRSQPIERGHRPWMPGDRVNH